MIILALGMLAAASCSTYAASRYIISADTTSALRAYRGQMVSVGPFTAPASPGRSEINCRDVKPIKTPDGEPFEEFIRKALVAELTIAEVYAPTAPVMLTGRLESIAFSSGTFPTAAGAAWRIRLVVASSNGRTLTVSEDYKFTSSYIGDVACNQTAHALMPAVQNLVGKIVRDPGFAELLSATLSLPAPFEEATAAMRRADYVTALRLLRPLAEQGYAPAQFDLGVMYTLGHGVFDYAEAVRWYRKAAEQGYAPAQW
jgi:hypothetical protein